MLERNHESYARGDALAASRQVERLARRVLGV
jgi:hypothetical protein